MKRFLAFLVSVVAFVCCAALFACGGEGEKLEGEMTVVVASGEVSKVYTVELSAYTTKSSVEDVLVNLSKDDENDFYYSGRQSQYGLFLTEVGYTTTVEHEAAGGFDAWTETVHNAVAKEGTPYAYVAVYCDVEGCYSLDYLSVEYEGKTLGFANSGVSGLPLKNGAVVYFTQG